MNNSKTNLTTSHEESSLDYDRGELLKFKWGTLSIKEIRTLLDALPIDLNFIDRDDLVQYYNDSPGKIHRRKKSVFGNKVQLCHSEATRPKVDAILNTLRSGKRDVVETRGQLDGRSARWRYIALRDTENVYIGTICITDYLDE